MERAGVKVPYLVGTMIELPRAALRAGEIAETAEFFSFGTNDLTQTVFGLSRDDSASFLGAYQRLGIFEHDPFVTLDTEGVGELVRIAAERGRAARPGLKLGICGEHGGDPASIRFCQAVGLDYVSCSPYRVPIARLAAAQAALCGRATGRDRLTARAGGLLLACLGARRRCRSGGATRTADPAAAATRLPAIAPPTPAPLPPPINPGYAAAPPNGLSPLLTQPGPVYELPAPSELRPIRRRNSRVRSISRKCNPIATTCSASNGSFERQGVSPEQPA